ncbi:hypothetical protein [Virgisporangium aurantiacum]|uniref:hypothetical protein n=1 Tax=Virgisporangium aurantiacum TaxID=175570 RepID=UPI00195116A1|nr:hypothetical protein [Virgisporangium aurantiacum]
MAIFVIVGALSGTAGGVLMWLSGMSPPAAIFAGAGCFITVVLFQMAVAEFVTRQWRP